VHQLRDEGTRKVRALGTQSNHTNTRQQRDFGHEASIQNQLKLTTECQQMCPLNTMITSKIRTESRTAFRHYFVEWITAAFSPAMRRHILTRAHTAHQSVLDIGNRLIALRLQHDQLFATMRVFGKDYDRQQQHDADLNMSRDHSFGLWKTR